MTDSRACSASLLFAALFLFCDALAAAPPKPTISSQHAFDQIWLRTGIHLRGVTAWRDPHGALTLVVSREWLQKTNPKFAQELLTRNRDQCRSAWNEALVRIRDELKTAQPATPMAVFLKQEDERLGQQLKSPDLLEPAFLWADVTPESVAKVVSATADGHRLALFAWNEGLTQVESRDTGSLLKELRHREVKLEQSPPDLSDRLLARTQNADEWSARRALISYALNDPVDFQGMGDTLARVKEGEPVQLERVLPGIMQEQLNRLLKDLTDVPLPPAASDDKWMKSAVNDAERLKALGFRVTRVQIDTTRLQVSVEMRFVARLNSGKWQSIWSIIAVEDGTKARPQVEARIEQDPQLKSALASLKSFGIADGGSLQQALRVGAATMAAQEAAESAFAEFRDRYTRRLDGPPLLTWEPNGNH